MPDEDRGRQPPRVSWDEECPPTGGRVAAMPPLLRLAWLVVFVGLIVLLTVLGRFAGSSRTGATPPAFEGQWTGGLERQTSDPTSGGATAERPSLARVRGAAGDARVRVREEERAEERTAAAA